MKSKYTLKLLGTLLLSTFVYGCGSPPAQNPTDPSNDSDGPDEVVDQPDPNRPQGPQKTPERLACERDPSGDGCECILRPNGSLCVCKNNPRIEGCECILHPELDKCACKVDRESDKCYCRKNPNSERCRPPTKYELCDRFCKRYKANDITDTDPLFVSLIDEDCDHDGLSYRQEVMEAGSGLETDPCNFDTDGDGLSDFLERSSGTLGGDSDTDGDGVSDARERELDLNWQAKRTSFEGQYGATDADLWVLGACETALKNLDSQSLQIFKEPNADWQILLPSNTTGTKLTFNEQKERRGGLFFEASGQDIYGGLISDKAGNFQESSTPLNKFVKFITESRHGDSPLVVSEETTHDGFLFTYGTAIIRTKTSLPKLREKLFFDLAGEYGADAIERSDVTSIPSLPAAAPEYREFYVKVTTIFRRSTLGENQLITLFAIAPKERWEVDSLVQMRFNDLTNTSNITQIANKNAPICVEMRTGGKKREVYFYFILDESGSMKPYHRALSKIANLFLQKVSSTDINYKLGITNIGDKLVYAWSDKIKQKQHQQGEVFSWTDNASTFISDVNIITDAGGDAEAGLLVAEQGMKRMVDGQNGATASKRIPAGALLLTTWVSDEPPYHYAKKQYANSYLQGKINYFKPRTTAFAIVKNPWENSGDGGKGYADTALATGGAFGILSSDASKYISTLNAIVDLAAGDASLYTLPSNAISSTLRVIRDGTVFDQTDPINNFTPRGEFVPRDVHNGFTFNARNNSLSFHGKYKPEELDEGVRGKDFIVLYNFYIYKTKEF